MFVSQEEAESLKEQKKEVESKNLGEAELEVMKKELQDSYDKKMSEMQKMVNVYFLNSICMPPHKWFIEIQRRLGSLSGGEDAKRDICGTRENGPYAKRESWQGA